jgi:tetratricopeptide (TPR) repeat protein
MHVKGIRRTGAIVLTIGLIWFPSLSRAQEAADIEAYDLSYARGLAEFGQGRYDRAADLFQEALKAKPADQDAGYYLGQSYIRTKRYDEAERIFRAMIAADPKFGGAWLGLGIVQREQRQYNEAIVTLTEAEKLSPDDPLVHFYLGLAFHDAGFHDVVPFKLLRAMALSPELAPIAQYYSGVSYYRRGIYEEAREAFEHAIQAQPDSSYALTAKEFLKKIPAALKPKPPTKRLNVSFITGLEYDTNVVLLPAGTSPPGGDTGISRQSDYRSVLYGNADLRLYQTDKWTSGISGGIYQTFHSKLSGFDVEDISPAFYVQRALGPARISAQYLYNYTLVGRSPYLISHTAQVVANYVLTANTFTQIQLRYQNKDFQDGRFPLNSARDGKNWLAGITQWVLFAENKGRFRIGYTYDTDNTGGGTYQEHPGTGGTQENADWNYEGHRFSVGVEFPPIRTLTLDLAFDWYQQQYPSASSFAPFPDVIRRMDNIYSTAASLSKPLTDNLRLNLQYSYSRDQNTLDVFDYNRSVYTISLFGSF